MLDSHDDDLDERRVEQCVVRRSTRAHRRSILCRREVESLRHSHGVASFTTIFPGWYSGRAVHIHYKIRTDATSSSGYEFTSQLFFDDALIDTIHAQQPYAAKGSRNVRNAADSIYNQGGMQVLMGLSKTTTGYAGAFNIALQM